MLSEVTRKKLIMEARQLGGLAIPHLKLQVHQNGAKFPISRVYVEDEQLESNTYYTVIAIPENPKEWGIAVTYFDQLLGPTVFSAFPAAIWDENFNDACVQWFDNSNGPGLFPSIARNLYSLNFFFEIPSEWNRTGKEAVMISFVADTKPNFFLEDAISTEMSNLSEVMKHDGGLFKAFYEHDKEKAEDLPEINEKEQKIQEYLLQLQAFVKNIFTESRSSE
ncbi:MAG TPA: hypothetical protein VKK79_16245 [Candidatus Lokiarchaeia archaeon]|nr:hypothetical protein [Candidatus Lokiarchaeia archaeon]